MRKLYSGELLDYFSEFSKLGKVTVINLGPFFKVAMCTHPDSFKWSLGQRELLMLSFSY